jgi:hypothetical protein
MPEPRKPGAPPCVDLLVSDQLWFGPVSMDFGLWG